MAGTQMTLTPFDGSKKMDWFNADVSTFINLWMGMYSVSLFVPMLLEQMIGLHPPLSLFRLLLPSVDLAWIFGLLALASACPCFVVVFVLRYNPLVVGPRRQFRYCCRWF
ncbi:MAG TPA: hypothetical protein VLG69_02740 [Candidatus Andersenbacteria bacterium]|nr:hypothetical protein [Candidatus Andersenbacteria bacterium]